MVCSLTLKTFLLLLWTTLPALALASQLRELHSTPKGWALREALERLDKDLYDNGPAPDRPYIASLKNPCWAASADSASGGGGGDDAAVLAAGAVRCLPYGLILGGFQCGAASLFAALYRHPRVLKTGVSRWHFWAEFDKRMAGYLEGMAPAAARIAAWAARLPQLLPPAPPPPASSGAVPSADVMGTAGAANGTAGAAWLAAQQPVLLDGSSSTFAFYWSPGMRAHRAFMASMGPCWKGCHAAHRKAGPERDACLEGGCYPAARLADRQVAAALGLPYDDVSLPLLVSAVYGSRPPKMVVLLRNPVDRLYSAFWKYGHYQDKYGRSVDGFVSYVREQMSVLRGCTARNASNTPGWDAGAESGTGGAQAGDMALRCLLRFETWGLREEGTFFHADQILRGVYVIYLERWFRFFDRRTLLVLRSEDYFAHPVRTYDTALRFLDLDPEAIVRHGAIERIDRILAKGSNMLNSQPKGGKTKNGGGSTDATAAEMRKALETPGDEKLWAEIRRLLTHDRAGRFAANRAAARSARGSAEDDVDRSGLTPRTGTGGGAETASQMQQQRRRRRLEAEEAGEGGSGGGGKRLRQGAAAAGAAGAGGDTAGRPDMPQDVRRELAAFYEPYNRRLAELLGDPGFTRGWG